MNLKWKRAESKSRPSPNRIPNYCGAWSIGLPSVRQPPLPLQLFLPLQPLSLVLQPPLPLQSFLPLQECLSLSCAVNEDENAGWPNCAPWCVTEALSVVAEPESKPLTAALIIMAFSE